MSLLNGWDGLNRSEAPHSHQCSRTSLCHRKEAGSETEALTPGFVIWAWNSAHHCPHSIPTTLVVDSSIDSVWNHVFHGIEEFQGLATWSLASFQLLSLYSAGRVYECALVCHFLEPGVTLGHTSPVAQLQQL